MDSPRVDHPTDKGSSPVLPAIWRRQEPLGYAVGLVSFSSIAAPLLTGFSLTTIVELIGRSESARGTRGDIAIAAFAIAAGLLIYAIQAGLAASQLTVPPDQRAAQTPEARGDVRWLKQLRQEQWRDAALAERLFIRTRIAYNLGIVAFLGGLVAVLVPDPKEWNLIRIIAIIAASTAGIIELVLASGELRPIRRWLFPTLGTIPDTDTGASNAKPKKVDYELARRLIYGESATPQDQVLAADGQALPTELAGLRAQFASLTGQLARLEVAIRDATPGAGSGKGD
jgi:hypothetical protein